ncbi:MAG: hypothetical protein ACFCU6_06875 [Balneolaceae bacterium]
MKNFEILITSPPDREKLVAEIWHKDMHVAEINQEDENLEIQIYVAEKILSLPFNDFFHALEVAKDKLLVQ